MKSTRHLQKLRSLVSSVQKKASPGERVISSLYPYRNTGFGSWASNRIQEAFHFRNWQYVAIDLLASKRASIRPNMAYSTDRPIRGATVKACQRSLMSATGRGFGSEAYTGAELRKSTARPLHGKYLDEPYDTRSEQGRLTQWRNEKETVAWGNYVGIEGWDPQNVSPVGFSGGGHSFLTVGEWRSKALSVVQDHENLLPLEHDHPLRRLIENPNPVDTYFDVEYELDMFEGLNGIAYEWTPKNQWGVPCERWCIPSHWVYPRTGGGKYVPYNEEYADELIWDYEIRPWGYPGYAGVLHFPPDEVIVYRKKNPLSKIDGWGKLSAGSMVVDLEEATTQSQWSQMINQGQPSMVVKLGPGYEDPDESEIARIEAKFFARVQGAWNYGRPIFVPSGAEATPWGYNPTEMAYQSGQDQARDRVLALYNLDKATIGLVENMTYGSVMACLGRVCAFNLNPSLTSKGQIRTKFLASQFDEHAPAYSTMSGRGHGSGAIVRRCKLWYDDCVPADPQQVNADLQLDITAYAVTPNEIRALRGRQPYRRGGDNPIVSGPGGPMPLVINANEDVDDMAEVIARLTQAEGSQTGQQQTMVDLAGKEDEETDSPTQLPGTRLSGDDHGATGLEPPETTNNPPSKSVRKQLDSSPKLLHNFPDVRQPNHWTCGAAAFTAVCKYFGVDMSIDKAVKLLGTNLQKSTDPAAIIRELRKLNISAKPKKKMSLEEIQEATVANLPVIVCLQDYGNQREEGASFDYGHYMTALHHSDGITTFQDSSIENVEREPGGDVRDGKPSGNISMPGRVIVDDKTLLSVWHDQRANGEKLVQFGIICGPKKPLGKIGKKVSVGSHS